MSDPSRVGRWFVLGGMGVAALAVLAAVTLVGYGGGPTTTAGLVGGLHRQLLVVAVPIAVVVEAALVYAVWRFHDNEDPRPTPDRPRLELGWTVATGLVILFVGAASYGVLVQPDVTAAAASPGDDVVDVRVTAQQWSWSVEYVDAGVTVEHADRLVLPVDRPVRLVVTSEDVIHSFHAPRLGLKQDAVPGQESALQTRLTEPGEYRLYCAEYCGEGHARMTATIEAVPPPAYRSWLASRGNASTAG